MSDIPHPYVQTETSGDGATPEPPDATADDELEAMADALLWDSAGERPAHREYSYYSERVLRYAHRRDLQRNDPPPPDTSLIRQTPAQLLESLFAELELPEMQERVLSLLRRGLNDTQIAQAMGIRPHTATRWRRRTVHLIRRQCRSHLLRLTDPDARRAFLEQMSPNLYSDESHCAPGQELCRRDGLCKHRWYLTQDETREW